MWHKLGHIQVVQVPNTGTAVSTALILAIQYCSVFSPAVVGVMATNPLKHLFAQKELLDYSPRTPTQRQTTFIFHTACLLQQSR